MAPSLSTPQQYVLPTDKFTVELYNEVHHTRQEIQYRKSMMVLVLTSPIYHAKSLRLTLVKRLQISLQIYLNGKRIRKENIIRKEVSIS